MKTLRYPLLIFALLVTCSGLVSAQTYNTTTTLTNAITDRTCNTRTMTFGSTSGWVARMSIFIDAELFIIQSVTNSTQAVMERCSPPTAPTLHSASSVVFWGPNSMFQQGATDGQGRRLFGACTVTDYAYLPIIDITTGNVYLCRKFGTAAPNTAAQWTWTNNQLGTYNSLLKNLN